MGKGCAMESIPKEVTIEGPVEQVFDLITQVRFWPQWHVLTRSVTGTVQRPFLPGDHFTEFIRTPKGTKEIAWEVTDYERGKKVTIQIVGSANSISYTFDEVPGGTLFRRVVNGQAAEGAASSDTEEKSVQNLKALVEDVLAHEKKGPVYP